MKQTRQHNEIFDARLTGYDEHTRVGVFEAGGVAHCVGSIQQSWWTIGTIGRLRLPSDGRAFGFCAYPDQRLRRKHEDDDPRLSLWGWQIEDRSFACKAGVIPGRDGLVVSEDTQTVVLKVPRELITLCSRSSIQAETVLRGFIADLCSLQNWISCPREDGYSSNGSDERQLAQAYFRRAYPWLQDGKSA